ncbi:MAG: type II toxin-antitoxin system RelB/DinJ family antitoxin [Anaerovoracaceae bacterium]
MSTTNMSIRIDKELKKQADELFADLGMSMSSALIAFTRQAVREQGIPFTITRAKQSTEYGVSQTKPKHVKERAENYIAKEGRMEYTKTLQEQNIIVDDDQNKTCGLTDDELTQRFIDAVKIENEIKRAKGVAVAKFDTKAKKVYLEYPDGRKEYE